MPRCRARGSEGSSDFTRFSHRQRRQLHRDRCSVPVGSHNTVRLPHSLLPGVMVNTQR